MSVIQGPWKSGETLPEYVKQLHASVEREPQKVVSLEAARTLKEALTRWHMNLTPPGQPGKGIPDQ
jgi:hypothetical protein